MAGESWALARPLPKDGSIAMGPAFSNIGRHRLERKLCHREVFESRTRVFRPLWSGDESFDSVAPRLFQTTTYPNGKREPRAITVRAGLQLRPAHLCARTVPGGPSKLERFLNMTGMTGQLVMRRAGSKAGRRPDLEKTMLRVIADHARTAAELYRWRCFHGAISLSNMEISGAMLDTTTQSAQPRTAALRVLIFHSDVNVVYGKEHLQRAQELGIMYRTLLRSLTDEQRESLNAGPIDFRSEMTAAYGACLELQMLRAAGLTRVAAERIQARYPDVAWRFKEVLVAMASLENAGPIDANKPPLEHLAVADVVNLLAKYPRAYFADPKRKAAIWRLLKPVFKGSLAHRKKLRATLQTLAADFAVAYSDVMKSCAECAVDSYGNAARMRKAVIAKAAFENRPLTTLYRGNNLEAFEEAVARYKASGDCAIIRRTIFKCIASSVRNTEP